MEFIDQAILCARSADMLTGVCFGVPTAGLGDFVDFRADAMGYKIWKPKRISNYLLPNSIQQRMLTTMNI